MLGDRGMFWACLLALAGLFSQVEAYDSSVYSGFLGCHYSRSVCQRDEDCVDDRLFGSCQRLDRPRDNYKYRLSPRKLQLLADEIEDLVNREYTWESLYTQCKLGNVLLAFRRGVQYDRYFCDGGNDRGSNALEDTLTPENMRLLEKYFQEYYNDLYYDPEQTVDYERTLDLPDVDFPDTNYNESPLPPPLRLSNALSPDDDWLSSTTKRDEDFLQVHKYQKAHKRDPLNYVPGSGTEDDDIAYIKARLTADKRSGQFDYMELLDSLSPAEMNLLQEYLEQLMEEGEEEEEEEEAEREYADVGNSIEQLPEADGYKWNDEPEGYKWNDEASETTDLAPAGNPEREANVILSGLIQDETFQSMSREDARLLLELLTGTRDVSTLSDEDIGRITSYLDSILASLDSNKDPRHPGEIMSEDMVDEPEGEDESNELPRVLSSEQDSEIEPAMLVAPEEDKRAPADQVIDDGETDGAVGDPHDHSFDDPMVPVPTKQKYNMLDANYCYLQVHPRSNDRKEALVIVVELESLMGLPLNTFTNISVHDGEIDFRVNSNPRGYNASVVATESMLHADELKNRTGFLIVNTGLGHDESKISIAEVEETPKYFVLTFVLCGVIAGVVLAVIAIYIVRRYTRSKEKLAQLATTEGGNESQDYQDLCRQRMQSKTSEKPEPIHVASRVGSVSTSEAAVRSPSSRSSTSSWSEEPVASNMDISTGHIVLSYMEDHLKNKDRLEQEWEALCAYEAEPSSTTMGAEPANMRRNRYTDILPYDHSRVVLNTATNVSGFDYINANTITDHDPRSPAYIATQGPLPHTVADFWQMVWEQGSVVIVNLTRLTEQGVSMCHRYWPEEGSDLYHIYEVHLVSEHIWCEDYLVRSLYLKNLQTNETRTVTQFHFLTWPDLGVPSSAKALLDFRRKVNKSYRGRSCPILVHCSDGVGRAGTYALIDMVLNRMSKGAKEIDIAASLEHIRDQRMQMVKTKEQFEFALAAVAEEVHAILKALPQ